MPNDQQQHSDPRPDGLPAPMTRAGMYLVLAAAFLGWFFAGMMLSTTSLAMRSAAIDLLSRVGTIDLDRFNEFNRIKQESTKDQAAVAPLSDDDEKQLEAWRSSAQEWFAYYTCAMLFGAATGGLVFGRLGDRIGRAKAMASAILCYSLFSAVGYFAETPFQLLGIWYLACMGIGGTWPNGVSLVAESWSDMSRPMAAGIIGTAANVGIFLLATIAREVAITPDHWRWVLLVVASPALLGVFVFAFVPESPRWLSVRAEGKPAAGASASVTEVFRRPFLSITLVGILLATVPLFGGWGSANWMIPWAGEAGETASPPNPYLKAQVGQARALTGVIGSLLGGWIASVVGRRRSYFTVSLAALFCAQYAFWFTVPTDPSFLFWVAALGFFSGIYFGWLPLCLPELFPTRLRSTGAGVSFNFGRIATATTIFATGALLAVFGGDYARIGRITSLIYAVGVIAIWLAPDTSESQLDD